jgi:hypothetical protein
VKGSADGEVENRALPVELAGGEKRPRTAFQLAWDMSLPLCRVADGLSPKRRRYATEKRPGCEKPHAYAIDETLSSGDADCSPSRANLSLHSVRASGRT